MNNLQLYLTYLNENLEDLKIPKKKWYDLLNIQRRKIYPKEFLLSRMAPEFIDYYVPIG